MDKRKRVICSECPCLNNDYKQGSECNLGYNVSLEWFGKEDLKVVKDTPDMRAHEEDFELFYTATDCKLVEIITIDKKITPRIVNG